MVDGFNIRSVKEIYKEHLPENPSSLQATHVFEDVHSWYERVSHL